ncbi:alpha-galactosidase, partial [Lactobacillus sp. HMSC077C11]
MFVDGAAEIDWRWLALTLTRSPAQKPAHKDLGRNDQTRVITPEATYVLSYAHNALPGAEV